ncbi:MAG: AraC family transcriptional regulator [Firmicutes bacterium]|nr:AraC family transcriptional regulator [Bacillota bacterium]
MTFLSNRLHGRIAFLLFGRSPGNVSPLKSLLGMGVVIMPAHPSLACHHQIRLSIYEVARSVYQSLNLQNLSHPSWIISHVRCGTVKTSSQGLCFIAQAGDVMVHPPSLPFSEYAEFPGEHEWFMADLWDENHVELLRLFPVFPVVTLKNPAGYSAQFAKLLLAWQDIHHPLRNARVAASAYDLVLQILNDWEDRGSPPRPEPLQTHADRFPAVIRFMHEHLDQPLRLAELADIVHWHPNYFHKVFRQTYGISPGQMLRRIRLERASMLLQTTDEAIEHIARACGMNDPAYFSRWFKQSTGLAPTAYRRHLRRQRNHYPSSP